MIMAYAVALLFWDPCSYHVVEFCARQKAERGINRMGNVVINIVE
jgi:hypothetical protein